MTTSTYKQLLLILSPFLFYVVLVSALFIVNVESQRQVSTIFIKVLSCSLNLLYVGIRLSIIILSATETAFSHCTYAFLFVLLKIIL